MSLQRSQYDPVTGRERKTNTHIPIAQTLVLDRFMATADAAKREHSTDITREIVRVRTRIDQLKGQKVSLLLLVQEIGLIHHSSQWLYLLRFNMFAKLCLLCLTWLS